MNFNCPHCEMPIEVREAMSTRQESVWVSLTNRPVSLGCGSLFAIAIIVAVCSGAGTQEVSGLRNDIRALNQKIDNLERMVRNLQQDGSAVETTVSQD